MKLWRKQARKSKDESGQVVRNGREIRYQHYIGEQMAKTAKKSYPLLDALFNKMGLRYVLTAKQVEALKAIKERNGENTNEVE